MVPRRLHRLPCLTLPSHWAPPPHQAIYADVCNLLGTWSPVHRSRHYCGVAAARGHPSRNQNSGLCHISGWGPGTWPSTGLDGVTLPDPLSLPGRSLLHLGSGGCAFGAAASLTHPHRESASDSHALGSQLRHFKSFQLPLASSDSLLFRILCWSVSRRLVLNICAVQSPGLGPRDGGVCL